MVEVATSNSGQLGDDAEGPVRAGQDSERAFLGELGRCVREGDVCVAKTDRQRPNSANRRGFSASAARKQGTLR